MYGDGAAHRLGRRDVIGAWLVCLAIAAACLALPSAAATDRPAYAAAAGVIGGRVMLRPWIC